MVLITRSKLPLKAVDFVNCELIVSLHFFSMWVAHGLHNDRSLRQLPNTLQMIQTQPWSQPNAEIC